MAISLPLSGVAAVAPAVTVLPPINGGGGPNSIAIAADGSIVVGNYYGGAINLLDPTGKFVKTINKEKLHATSIGLAADGTILAATNTTVTKVSPAGDVLGVLPYTFQDARSFTTDDLGYIYVVDAVACKIVVFTPSFQYYNSFASKGTAPGQMQYPQDITFNKVNRQLLVADNLNNRVDIFDLNGNFIQSFGTVAAAMGRATLPMEFHSIKSVAIEYTKVAPYIANRIYVVDNGQNLIQVIDASSLTPLIFPGKTTNFINGPMELNLSLPVSATFDQVNGRLLVANGIGVSVFGIDGGGNPADTTPPTLSVNPPLATVHDPILPIAGTVEAGSTVSVSFSGAATALEYVGTENWKTVLTLAPGKNSFTVTAKDAAGNVTAPQAFIVDYILPAPAVALTSAPSITNAANVTISGTVDALAAVSVTNKTTAVTGDATVSGTKWSYSLPLAEGLNALAINAKGANTETATVDAVVTLDTVSPQLTVSALSNNSVTATQVQNISGAVIDAGQVAVTVNNVPVDVINGAYSTAITLADGANQILVIAADAAGNSVQDLRSITYDGTKPAITLADATLPDNAVTKNQQYTISGQISEVAAVKVAGADVALDSNNSWSSVVNLLPGLNTVEVVATDLAGNSSSVKRSVTYSVATVDLAILYPAQDVAKTKRDGEIRFVGSVTSDSAVSVSYSVNGGKSLHLPLRNNRFKFELEFNKPGTYSVAITAKDALGVEATAVRTVVFDKHGVKQNRR